MQKYRLYDTRPLRHGNVDNRLFRYGKCHSQHMEKQRAAFPRPVNSISHSSIRQPVTHITTTPTTTETQPILPVIHKEIFKELT